MRILHLLYESEGDTFGIGGVGIRAYKIARHLMPRHRITFLCKRYSGAKDGTIRGVPHVFAGSESTSLTKTLLSYAAGSRKFVQRHGAEYDVIVEEFAPGVPTFLSDRTCGRPVVLQLQSYYGAQYFRKYNPMTAAVLYALERIRPGFHRHFIVVNDRLLGRYRISRDRSRTIATIGNGVDEELLKIEEALGDSVLFLGRIDVHTKGLDLLLDAFDLVLAARPRSRLVIAGDGRDAPRFRELLARCPERVRAAIEMAGWVEDGEKIRVLKNARMVVLPSRYEAQPITTLEAMAAGRPLIVSPIEELSYVAEGGAGLAMDGYSGEALAARIMEVFGNDDLAAALGRRGRQAARNHTWKRVAASFEDYLSQVVMASG